MFEFFKKKKENQPQLSSIPNLSIYCKQGEYAGTTFPLKAGETISIGKNPELSNIILSDAGVSRLHCTITYSETSGNYVITDYSSNGVYLENGSRLTKEVATQIPCNSSIFFGKSVQVFELNKTEETSFPKTEQIVSPAKKKPDVEIPAPDRGRHTDPQCTHCGYVGPWKVDHLLRPIDIIIFLIFLWFWGAGFIYLIVVIIIRLNPDRRAKICPNCKARNLWTFHY